MNTKKKRERDTERERILPGTSHFKDHYAKFGKESRNNNNKSNIENGNNEIRKEYARNLEKI